MKERYTSIMKSENHAFTAQKIRDRYTEKQATDIDTLMELDRHVRRPASVFAYIFGSVSAIIMGAGMSLIMTDIASVVGIQSNMTVGIAVGAVGLVLAVLNYPIYRGILNSRKKKHAARIVELSDRIIENKQDNE